MKLSNSAFAAVLCCAAFVGCRTTKEVLDDYERDIQAGDYEHATKEVSDLAKKGGNERLLWQLLSGSAYCMSGDFDSSIEQFDLAEDSYIEHDARSVFSRGGEGAWAMLTNDKAFEYDGGGEDRVFTCFYKAVQYAAKGDSAAARTEFNRAAAHQENWIDERKSCIAAAEARLGAEAAKKSKEDGSVLDVDGVAARILTDKSFCGKINEECEFNPFSSGDLDKLTAADYVNPYVQHVTGVFRWLNKEHDAQYYFRDVGATVANSAAARDLEECRAGKTPQGEVWIYAEDGLCMVRDEWRLDLPLILIPYVQKYVMYAGMALPKLRTRPLAAQRWSVSSGGESRDLEILADIDKLAKTEYDVYMRGALKREITRTLVKIGGQVALGILAERAAAKGDKQKYWVYKASQASAAAWALATTGADLRSWTSLPKCVRMTRVTRPADGKIVVTADSERIEIDVPQGNSMVFLRKPAATARTSVIKVTYQY